MILTPTMNNYNGGVQPATNYATILNDEPAEITLSENVNNFKFEPALTGGGAKSLLLVQPLNYVAVGATITITSNYGSMVLTASATPSANEFWTNATVVTPTAAYLQQVAESIADAINQNISFNNSYIISLNSPNVTVYAKQYGSAFNFTASTSTPSTIYVFASAGSSYYESDNLTDYSCWAELYIGSTDYADTINKYEMEFVDKYIIDSAKNEANLAPSVVGDYVEPILPYRNNVSAYLAYLLDKGQFSDGTLYPQLDHFGNQKKHLKPYFILYGDSFRYITNGQKKRYTKGCSKIRWVQLGAFDKLLPYNMADYTWLPNNTKNVKWMTTAPKFKTVTYTSHEYLQLICKKTATSNTYWLSITCNFYDGTSVVVNKPAQSANNISGNISFDVSPTALDIQSIETSNGKLIDTYEVKLVWGNFTPNNAQSQTRYYVVDRECYENKKQIIFLNEFGAWDSLEFLGQITEEIDRDVENIQRNLPSNANDVDAISEEVAINISSNVQSSFTLHSGLLSEEYVKWSKKIVESSAVFIWDETYLKYRNIIITDFDIVYDTKLRADSVSITFTYTTTNNTIKR